MEETSDYPIQSQLMRLGSGIRIHRRLFGDNQVCNRHREGGDLHAIHGDCVVLAYASVPLCNHRRSDVHRHHSSPRVRADHHNDDDDGGHRGGNESVRKKSDILSHPLGRIEVSSWNTLDILEQ